MTLKALAASLAMRAIGPIALPAMSCGSVGPSRGSPAPIPSATVPGPLTAGVPHEELAAQLMVYGDAYLSARPQFVDQLAQTNASVADQSALLASIDRVGQVMNEIPAAIRARDRGALEEASARLTVHVEQLNRDVAQLQGRGVLVRNALMSVAAPAGALILPAWLLPTIVGALVAAVVDYLLRLAEGQAVQANDLGPRLLFHIEGLIDNGSLSNEDLRVAVESLITGVTEMLEDPGAGNATATRDALISALQAREDQQTDPVRKQRIAVGRSAVASAWSRR